MRDELFLGQTDWASGHAIASSCPQFFEDVEEEWLAQEPVSCYNCRYRRFVKNGIICIGKGKD